MVLLAPLNAIAGLLLLAGVTKLRDPLPARAALRAAGLPASAILIYGAGLGEAAVGVVCLAAPGRVPEVAMAVLYVLFAVVVARQLRGGSSAYSASCGCLGAVDAPPSWIHFGFNLTAATIAGAAASSASPDLLHVMLGNPMAGAVVVGGSIVAIRLAVGVFTDLPTLLHAFQRPSQ